MKNVRRIYDLQRQIITSFVCSQLIEKCWPNGQEKEMIKSFSEVVVVVVVVVVSPNIMNDCVETVFKQ
ncbi:unnamed protein product [Ixodes pacificus]